ncbi:MAG: GNAT family protein [Chloroflexota bacterium]
MPAPLNPILRDFPDRFETERLLIRAPRPGDGAAGNEAIRESEAELKPWMPWVHPLPSLEVTEQFYRQAAARWLTRESLPMILLRKEDGLFVGGSGLMCRDWSVPFFEIGYWVRTSLQRQGYITEAVRAQTRFAFDVLGARRVELRCDARNTRSAAVAERAGYALEGRLRHFVRDVEGKLADMLIYARLAGD